MNMQVIICKLQFVASYLITFITFVISNDESRIRNSPRFIITFITYPFREVMK